jgi:periplasmic protein CpxP/Spy
MDKIKLLTFSVILLLVINIGTLLFLVFSFGDGLHGLRHRPKPDKIIIGKLHLSEKQQKQYRELIHWHRSQINNLESHIQHTKHELYLQLLKPDVDQIVKDSLIDHLSKIQKKIEDTHFKHFQDIKKICTKEQIQDFDDLTEELTTIFNHPPPRPND